jgi:hypothetical protein
MRLPIFACVVLGLVGCSGGSSSDAGRGDAGPATCSAPGMPTAGAADTHCAPDIVQPVAEASCFGAATDSGETPADAGVEPCEYGATLFGMEGDDDDCKYHVAWTSTPICEGAAGTFFTAVVTSRETGMPVVGGDLRAETFVTAGDACDTTTSHPGPNTFSHMAEGPPGTYTGAIVFDQSGQWTVRFHVRDECSDSNEDSPHGHVAFRLTVP